MESRLASIVQFGVSIESEGASLERRIITWDTTPAFGANAGCEDLISFFRRVLSLAIVILLVPTVATAGTITLGVIGEEPAEDIKKTLPLAVYLSKQLAAEGITQGKVFVAKSMNEMASMLRDGKVDLSFDSYARTLALSRLTGSRAILRRWKKGVAEYNGVLFARSDSGIHRIEDLRGKTMALEEEFSTVAQLLPKFMIIEKRLKLVPPNVPVPADGVGYLYAYFDVNTILWVMQGRVAAGAMDSQTYAKLSVKHGDHLRIIATTPSVPRHVVSTRPGLPQALFARVTEILLRMDQSEEGKKVLEQFEKTAKFDGLVEQNPAFLRKIEKLIETEMKFQ
jgi:phosphonate transport system substrate-binding protein